MALILIGDHGIGSVPNRGGRILALNLIGVYANLVAILLGVGRKTAVFGPDPNRGTGRSGCFLVVN